MTPDDQDPGLAAVVDEAVGKGSRRYTGLAVGAIKGAHTAVGGSGVTRHKGVVPEATTLFQIGSITKVFTALLLADGVTRNEVTLDTTVAECIPALGGTRADITTLRQLASHTSGLPRLPKGLVRQALRHRADPYRDFSVDDLYAAVAAARKPRRTQRVRYSNFGAGLLGAALSRRIGLPYESLVRERVTAPLGLHDTVVRPSPEQLLRKATGHSRRGRPVPDWDLGALAGAGALYSTPADLLTLLRAHVDPDATALAAALHLVTQPQARMSRWLSVGLGWHLSPVQGTTSTSLWHNGGTGGFFSYAAVVPQDGIGVVVLSNTARSVDALGNRLLRGLTH